MTGASLLMLVLAVDVSLYDPDLHYTLGVQALQQKQVGAAVHSLSACVKAAPERVDCQWQLGWAYSVQGRWSEALAAWTAVERQAPRHPELAGALQQARAQVALQARLATPPDGSTRPRPPAGARLRLRAVGDVMMGTDFPEGLLPPGDGATVLAGVKGLLEDADLTFVNLEGPLCDSGTTNKCRKGGNCYAFRTPTRYGQYLKASGVDVASTANNHSGDFGEECRRETERALDALGIAWSGAPGSVATLARNGLKMGLIAFHTSPACNYLNDTETAAALVRSVAATHDLVVVSFHGGAEGSGALHVPAGREVFFGEDRGDLRVFTHAVVDAGADLVLGHGPHVVRGMELYNQRLIAYSLGNFTTYGPFNLKGPQGLGLVLDVTLDAEGRFVEGRALPTMQPGKGGAVPDPSGQVLGYLRQLSSEDFPGTGVHVDADGRIR